MKGLKRLSLSCIHFNGPISNQHGKSPFHFKPYIDTNALKTLMSKEDLKTRGFTSSTLLFHRHLIAISGKGDIIDKIEFRKSSIKNHIKNSRL